jgi:glycosyltransferase involved in cell wall biosynthesis
LTHAASQARAIRDLGIAAPVEVLPLPAQDALPPTADRRDARLALGLGMDEVVFLFFGHVRAYKGVDVLLEALARLPEAGPPWRALIVGEWYIDRASAGAAVAQPRLRARVTIEDRFVAEPEIARYFAAANATVLPYRAGTQSGVVSMSYALDRPVVASDVEGLAEAVVPGETGLVVPREDPAALARALDEVRHGRQFSRDTIAHAHRAATWERLVAAVEAVAPRAAC